MTYKHLIIIAWSISLMYGQNTFVKKYQSEIDQLKKHGVMTTQIDNNNLLICQNDSSMMIKNFQQPDIAVSDTGDLILTLADLDTTEYYSKYKYFAELPLGEFYTPNRFTFADANKNGRKEIYGNRMQKSVGSSEPFEGFVGFECGTDSLFKQILFIPDSFGGPSAYGDVDGDGLIDIALFKNGDVHNSNYLFTQSSPTSLPNTVKTKFDTLAHLVGAQLRSFVDLDGDGKDETIYKVIGTSLGEYPQYSTIVARYDIAMKEFTTIFTKQITDPNEVLTYTYGLSFGDFDGDGKMNIGTGSENGYAYTHEYQGNNTFTTKLIARVATKNLYLTSVTKDFNGNGKPEVWFGGDTFFNGTAITRLYAFEANGDDQYQKVYQIDIVGLFSLIGFKMQSRDMDNDGIEELFVHLGQRILIFKNTEKKSFKLWYVKINELTAAGLNSVIFNSDAEDIDGDGNKEIFLETDNVVTQTTGRKFTTIFKKNNTASVKKPDNLSPHEFVLFQNYPNPFNPTTVIKYQLSENRAVVLKIFDLLGREVATLVNERQEAGIYSTYWNASQFSSGIYFAVLKAGSFTATKKLVLMK